MTALCFFFNDPATTEIYTLSLHDALPIPQLQLDRAQPEPAPRRHRPGQAGHDLAAAPARLERQAQVPALPRSEEHTSELQSRQYLVCRLLLEKKKNTPQQVNLHDTTNNLA